MAAYVLQLGEFAVLWLLTGASAGLFAVPILAAFGLVRMAISGMTGAVIVYAILSWVPTQSVMADVIGRLVAPALAPIRRVLPLVGGIDLSPLALLLILQIAGILLGSLQATVLVALAS
ncbi:YGGT family protein [mine drainage metagenome]|uniref:YGGT family protein n=1 Tax=mine drainage metagenome TaxID=410659 RepID=A0A1J5P690_9ZZZZ